MADEFALLVADVYELAGALRQSGESLAAAEGQTQARWQLMSAVSAAGLTVPQAARRLGVSRQAVQRIANELVAAHIAEFTTNPDHRTSPVLVLTGAGRDVLGAINRRARRNNRRLAESIDSDAVAATRAGIREILSALRD